MPETLTGSEMTYGILWTYNIHDWFILVLNGSTPDPQGKIGDSYLEGGLEGSALNLVIVPMGWVALGLAVVGTTFHVVINKWLACNARSNLVSGSTQSEVQAMSPSTIGKSTSNYSAFKDTE